MSTTNDERGSGRKPSTPARSPRPDTARDRTTLAQAVPGATTANDAFVNTTEIPVTVAHGAGPLAARGTYYDGGNWYRDPDRRQPAPVGLRVIVWFLFFIFVLALIGLAVVHYHPTWVSFLRATSSSAPGIATHQLWA